MRSVIIRKTVTRAIILITILLLAIASGKLYFGSAEYRFLVKRVENIIETRTAEMVDNMEVLANLGFTPSSYRKIAEELNTSDLTSKGITLLAFDGDHLFFWSDKSFDVPEGLPAEADKSPVLFLHNGYFLHHQSTHNDTTIIGVLRIYNVFDIENKLVQSGFPSYFGLPDNAVFVSTPEVSDYHVSLPDGKYGFSILFQGEKKNSLLLLLPVILWILFTAALLVTIDNITLFLTGKAGPLAGVSLKLILFLIFYLLLLNNFIPEVLKRTDLFNASGFSLGGAIPAMGHLLMLSIFSADIMRSFNIHFFNHARKGSNTARDFLGFTLALIPGTLLLIGVHQILHGMAAHTNLNFEGYRISQVGFLTVVGMASLYFLILAPGFYLLKILKIYSDLKNWAIMLGVLINLVLFADIALFGVKSGFVLAFLYVAIIILLKIYTYGRIGIFNLSAIFSILFAFYATWYISRISARNEYDSLKVSAVTYAAGHDPVAEHLLMHLSGDIESDTLLASILSHDIITRNDADMISEYLRDVYFGSYWTNYDFSVVMCNESSTLLIEESGLENNCFGFFEERIQNGGENITGTPFYYLDNETGRPYYIGKFYFGIPSGGKNGLFIELFSYINAFREGYPELLADERYMPPRKLVDYSFAKYINGVLVLNTGDYSYPMKDIDLSGEEEEYHALTLEGYDHFIYRQGKVTVVQSRKSVPFISRIVSFAYIFLFVVVISSFLALFYRKIPGKSLFLLTFRQKLQIAFVTIIMFTFLGIAAGASYLSIEQYRQRHDETIREKASSLYIELEHKLGGEPSLDNEWTDGKYLSLSDLLVKFSNVFFTDINLYDSDGFMLATSRPEVFIRDLTSRRMDKMAFISLTNLTQAEHITRERIGNLEYLSIYVPFYNSRNELLAFINVPYFGMQSKLSAEISNLIVAIVNFSLLMILATMSLAVFISDRITSPIRMLGEVLASVRLGKRSERLTYSGRDEIGDLVSHYNKMVEELEESARKLSASEREYAWREMAKQIAHEIKNPLTPMKLNVQQLEKAWKDGKPGFEKKLEKFTRNQVEYIDNLSSIATAFSNFARMPKAEPVNIDLLEQVRTTLELFKSSDNVSFRVTCNQAMKIMVFADREHLNSVFSNLVKNAIQAIPQQRSGLVKISLNMEGDRVIVKISDNGDGIPEELKIRLFTPYFTTKSSGSGLGLSIVKRLVEGMGGQISFESVQGEGTTFMVSLPVIYSVERPE
ncbi:MAG: HAMP domain-containing histidine kinase [Bacteroidales bacterium]|nr:HAMP domain-containing histidine kinase [Bacteroidales bacterium]